MTSTAAEAAESYITADTLHSFCSANNEQFVEEKLPDQGSPPIASGKCHSVAGRTTKANNHTNRVRSEHTIPGRPCAEAHSLADAQARRIH